MKVSLLFISIMALCLLIIPMIALDSGIGATAAAVQPQTHSPPALEDSAPPAPAPIQQQADTIPATNAPEPPEELPEEVNASKYESVSSFLILDESTGMVNEVPLRDFIRGAIAAEMPASFHSEALKAQAVAAHTFALHNHIVQQENPDPALKGADFSADPSNMKVYITEAAARDFYGDNAELYWNKMCAAADSVAGYILEYDDEPIVAAYHAISAGQTEDASNVWSGSAPYLQSVPSDGDILAPGFESTATFTAEEVRERLTAACPGINLSGDPSDWFGVPQRSGSGYVNEIGAGDQILRGKDIRGIFDLRSHNFEISYSDAGFTFTVTGYGHGIGLSQYGADFLARQGYTFDAILGTYYTGARLVSVN